MTRKQKRILKNKIENIIVKTLAFIIFISPIILYCIACYITSLV